MRTTLLVLGFVLFGLIQSNAQEELSSYKYVIVPTKFDGFKKENHYQTSTLVKYHLVKRGFNAVYTNALPLELTTNRCQAVTAVLVDESNMLTIKVHISFQDCNSVVVYRTATASSKIKEYKAAYKEAIERSFQSLGGYTYSYKPADKEAPIVVNFGDDVKTLEPEPGPVRQQTKEVIEATPVKEEMQSEQQKERLLAESAAVAGMEKEAAQQISAAENTDTNEITLLYAQEIPNGFQLVDSTPKVLLRIYSTQKQGVFLAKSEQYEGVVYQEQGKWYLDYYQDGKLVHQTLNIKF